MGTFVLFACPGCTFSSPVFLTLSMFIGTVPAAYLLLRPYTRSIRKWGLPRIDVGRLSSLALMLLYLVPLWFIGRQENPISLVAFALAGLATCCLYLWLRSCWLLDAHHVTSLGRELLFPGLLTPAFLVLGTTVGSWVLGILLVVPMFPMFFVPHTIWSIVIGVPVGLIAVGGLKYTFAVIPGDADLIAGDAHESVGTHGADDPDE